MNPKKQSVIAALGVASAATMVVAGSFARDRVDLGGKTLTEAPLANLVASRTNQNVPEGDYFHEIAKLLHQEYVEPIQDERKLAVGAVRGMVASLGDPKSVYMDKDEFPAFLRRREGIYEGIGAEIDLVMPASAGAPKQSSTIVGEDGEIVGPAADMMSGSPRIPLVTVISVVPGGPADKAGVKPGDVAHTVDDRWIWNADLILRFRKAQKDWDAKKITIEQLNKLRNEIREKTERDMLPHRARQRLMLGKEGQVKVVWNRKGNQRTTVIRREESKFPGLSEEGNQVRLKFVAGAAQWLKKAVEGDRTITIDLRDNTLGDYGEMKRCLAIVAPAGTYGSFVTKRSDKPTPLKVVEGNAKPPKMTILVNQATRGAAAIFTSALKAKSLATVQGNLPTDNDVIEIVQLPDGSGYTLVTSEFQPGTARVVRRQP